jgi:outer membrane receptor protein involved in Fe transport
LYAEGEKGFGAHIKVGAKLAWWQFKNLPMYIQYNPFQQENIGITYGEQLNAVSLDLKLRLQIANELSFGGALKLMNYSNMDYTTPLASNKAWGLPKTMLNLDVIWQPITPLTISAYLNYFSGVDAYFNSVEYQLAPYTDLGFGAEYSIIKNLSAFINCNNLLNKSNERWLFYPSYGTNIYGGLRVKF